MADEIRPISVTKSRFPYEYKKYYICIMRTPKATGKRATNLTNRSTLAVSERLDKNNRPTCILHKIEYRNNRISELNEALKKAVIWIDKQANEQIKDG